MNRHRFSLVTLFLTGMALMACQPETTTVAAPVVGVHAAPIGKPTVLAPRNAVPGTQRQSVQ